jgi:hypothetical protein
MIEYESKKLYKVLKGNLSFHGGDFEYSLPRKRGRGWKPGNWHEVEGFVKACHNGYHLTTSPFDWFDWGATIYEAEGEGDQSMGAFDSDKIAFRRARLLRPAPVPAFVARVSEFMDTLKTFPKKPDGKPNPKWELHPSYSAAHVALSMFSLSRLEDRRLRFNAEVMNAADQFLTPWENAWRQAAEVSINQALYHTPRRCGASGALYARCNLILPANPSPLSDETRAAVDGYWEVWQKGYIFVGQNPDTGALIVYANELD